MNRPAREHPRYAHEAAVTLYVGGVAVAGRTANVSRGGLCAYLSDPVPAGLEIELALQLVFDDERQSEPLHLPARIVWCTHVDDAHQVGVSFRSVEGEQAEFLTMFLRYLEGSQRGAGGPPRPPRPPRPAVSIDDRFR